MDLERGTTEFDQILASLQGLGLAQVRELVIANLATSDAQTFCKAAEILSADSVRLLAARALLRLGPHALWKARQ